MKGKLHIVGLGSAGLEQMSLGNYRLLREAAKVYLRTANHPCAIELRNEGLEFRSFDDLYDRAGSFEEVYEGIVVELQAALEEFTEVVYAVPGHPNVAEKSVLLIQEKLGSGYSIHIYPALSFLDALFSAMAIDPIQGCLIRNHEQIKQGGITGKDWLIIPQVYDRFVASELKLDLMKYYADEAEIFLLSSLGLPEESVQKIMLYQLDHFEVDHLTTVAIPPQQVYSMEALLEVMQVLRSERGCPWDKEQTHESLKPYVIEEAYEVFDAINSQDMYNLCEELGDLLLQVVFHARVAEEQADFDFQDVLQGIVDKLIRRHPHVFGNRTVENASEVIKTWEEIKQSEKGLIAPPPLFKDTHSLPGLMLAAKTQERAARLGFDWDDLEGPFAKIYEELDELRDALAQGMGIEEELGDVLFSIVNVSRFLKLDAEEALRGTTFKFQHRFNLMLDQIKADGLEPERLKLEELDQYWEKAKKIVKSE